VHGRYLEYLKTNHLLRCARPVWLPALNTATGAQKRARKRGSSRVVRQLTTVATQTSDRGSCCNIYHMNQPQKCLKGTQIGGCCPDTQPSAQILGPYGVTCDTTCNVHWASPQIRKGTHKGSCQMIRMTRYGCNRGNRTYHC